MGTLASTRLSMCLKPQQTAEMNTPQSEITKIASPLRHRLANHLFLFLFDDAVSGQWVENEDVTLARSLAGGQRNKKAISSRNGRELWARNSRRGRH